jgi:hypothetical protein
VFWQLNYNFVVLTIEVVLNMLHSLDCKELSGPRQLAASSDASIIENILVEVQKIVDRLVHRWWKKHVLLEALCRLEKDNKNTLGLVINVW